MINNMDKQLRLFNLDITLGQDYFNRKMEGLTKIAEDFNKVAGKFNQMIQVRRENRIITRQFYVIFNENLKFFYFLLF